MTVRLASPDDLGRILQIYDRARSYMREIGNPDQWGSVYPPEELLREDIGQKRLYVIEDSSDSSLHGVFAFFGNGDSIYNNIEGNWLNDLPHAAIHRVASSGERRGILKVCVDFCLSRSKNLKIDTHTQNSVMRHQLAKLGFTQCGTIYLEDGDPRIAFQLYKEDNPR